MTDYTTKRIKANVDAKEERRGRKRKMPETLTGEDFCERIGMFLDNYVEASGGGRIPRSIPYFKDAFKTLLSEGIFSSPEEIRKACLREQLAIIPDFLLPIKK